LFDVGHQRPAILAQAWVPAIYLRCEKKRKVYAMKKRNLSDCISNLCLMAAKTISLQEKTVERIEPIVNEESHSAMEKALGRGRMH
jgi:hypothetical protein